MGALVEIEAPGQAPVQTPSENAGKAVSLHTAGSMTELLFMAVEKGTSVAELKELVALHGMMEQRQAQKDFAEAMARFQKECPSIKKSSKAKFATNGGGNMSYTFAALDEIANTVNPLLAKHGLSYTWDSEVTGDKITCVCTVRHRNGHSTTSTITLPTDSKSAMSSQQRVGSAFTFARRLSLTAALGLTTTDEDIDGRDVEDELITEEQADALSETIAELNVDIAQFLAYLKVQSLADIPASRYATATIALEAKRKQRAKS